MDIDSGGVNIHVEVTGEGPPVVLLHGFPDSGALWRHQVPTLVDAGFRCIVPDLRGYGATDAPDGVDAYNLLFSVGDVVAVLDHLGVDRAHVVGHDWGAALAWTLASFLPDRVDHLAALSVGHPAGFRTSGMDQLRKSWYMFFFQFEGVAEQWLSADGWANFRDWFGHPDADDVVARWEATGTLTAALNWYRANVAPTVWVGPPLEAPPVVAPTLGVWSTGDAFCGETQMIGSERFVTGSWRYERLEGVGHHLPLEAPDELNRLLLDFLPR
jgi:pimeloyl-ACP methyl ester carboxylesterase